MRMEAAELRDCGRLKDIRAFIDGLYAHDLYARRVDSLAAATLGVMTGASLAVAMIGQALAQARGLVTRHAIKQVDHLLSNGGIDVWESFARWVPHLLRLEPHRLRRSIPCDYHCAAVWQSRRSAIFPAQPRSPTAERHCLRRPFAIPPSPPVPAMPCGP